MACDRYEYPVGPGSPAEEQRRVTRDRQLHLQMIARVTSDLLSTDTAPASAVYIACAVVAAYALAREPDRGEIIELVETVLQRPWAEDDEDLVRTLLSSRASAQDTQR